MELYAAWGLASEFMGEIALVCDRVSIAGSIRRRKPDVRDIEVVAIPTVGRDLFGEPQYESRTALDLKLDQLGYERIKDGLRYKQLLHPANIKIDLFLVLPPAQWGTILAIRTGPADFSHWLVTPKVKGGLLPAGLRVQFGGVYRGVELIPTPEETDLFELLELPYIPPEARCAQWSR